MRALLAAVLAFGAIGAVLASTGVAVPPHLEPPGTPRIHDHLLAAYRYPLFLLRLTMLSHPVSGPSWTFQTPGGLELGGLVLATLALVIPRLPRPTRRAVAVLAAPVLRVAQWRLDAPLGPPRATLLVTA